MKRLVKKVISDFLLSLNPAPSSSSPFHPGATLNLPACLRKRKPHVKDADAGGTRLTKGPFLSLALSTGAPFARGHHPISCNGGRQPPARFIGSLRPATTTRPSLISQPRNLPYAGRMCGCVTIFFLRAKLFCFLYGCSTRFSRLICPPSSRNSPFRKLLA